MKNSAASVKSCAMIRLCVTFHECPLTRSRHTRTRLAATLTALVAWTGMAWTGSALAAPKFALPIACKPGFDCFVQNYVDRDTGDSAVDHRCGGQTYDGHKGTDIRLRDARALAKGVNVLAAAKGKVSAVRDGMKDVSIRDAGTESLKGKECGNGVVVEHGGGWVTQYCHMRKGSIRVKPGATVKAGTVLGQVGLSGFTEFAHLHFEVRRNKDIIDPFTTLPVTAKAAQSCVPRSSLWTTRAANLLSYRPVTLLAASFTSDTPTLDGIEQHEPERPTSVSPALVAWVRILGVRAGDIETLTVTDPLNRDFATSGPKTLDRAKAQWLSFAGRKRSVPSWPLGNYKARYTLERDGKMLVEKEFSFSLVR